MVRTTRKKSSFFVLAALLVLLASRVGRAGESYVLTVFEGNIEEKDVSVQVVNGGYAVTLRSWDIFCVRFPRDPDVQSDDEYWIEAFIEDIPKEFESVRVSGTAGSTSLTYNIYAYHPKEWWSTPNIFVKKGDMPPGFPQYYTMSIVTSSGQTGYLNKTVTEWEWAEPPPTMSSVSEGEATYVGSFRTKEHEFKQQVTLKSLTIDAELGRSQGIEVSLYGKEANDSDWEKVGTYAFTSGNMVVNFDEKIIVKKVKYGLIGTEGIKLVAQSTTDTPCLRSLTLEIFPEFMITFDDGPLPGKTDKIVDALKDFYVDGEPVRAGFFMLGDNNPLYHAPFELWPLKGSVKDYPQIVRYVAERGHLIGNHTQHHMWFWWGWPNPSKLDVRDEIMACNNELESTLGKTPLKIFRAPYLVDNQAVRTGVAELGFQIVWGKTVGDTIPFVSVETVKEKALQALKEWKKDEPCILIFHDNRPATYNHIAEIIHYLENQGFALVHFDPYRISEEKPELVLAGGAHSPVDLNIIDPDGLILSKEESEILGAIYEEVDIDRDGKVDDFFIIPERKVGNYLIQVLPEPNTLPTDTYSLEVTINGQTMVLAKDVQIEDIPPQPYKVESKLCYSDFDADGDVDFADYAVFGSHWMDVDCNYPNWCEGTDLDYNGIVDSNDLAIFVDNWLWEKIPADIDIDGDVDFADYAIFANHWLETNCAAGNWCNGADLNKSGEVDVFDGGILAKHWLESAWP